MTGIELKLSIDKKTGLPIIKFRHHDKSENLQQLLLGVFTKGAKEKGLMITQPNGKLSDTESYENYEIRIKP